MQTRYFVENNKRLSYLAFDAPKRALNFIEARLNDHNAIVANGKVKPSIRDASDGKRYKYYTRLQNRPLDNIVDSIFQEIKQSVKNSELDHLSKKLRKSVEEIHLLRAEVRLRRLSARIKLEYPEVLPHEHILREEMISALLSTKPVSKNEFRRLIPYTLRAECSGNESRIYLEKILSIFN